MDEAGPRTLLVTGGASGIGEAIARLFASRGARVVLFDRDGERAAGVRDALRASGGTAETFIGDVAEEAACRAAAAFAHDRFGSLDTLVNNAGFGLFMPTLETPIDRWQAVLSVNLTGTFLMTREAVRIMLSQKRPGAVVNVASVHGLVGMAGLAAYTASKGGVVNLTRSLALEYAPHGIRVNVVCPGVIATPLTTSTVDAQGLKALEKMHPLGRIGQPAEVAHAVYFLASAEAAFITGATLAVDGGFTAQ